MDEHALARSSTTRRIAIDKVFRMSTAPSVVLLLLSFFWLDPAAAQRASRDSPPWSLSVREGQLSASIDRIPLRRVLEELARQTPLHLSVSEKWRDHPMTAHFRALPLGKALAQLLAGLSYALIYTPAPTASARQQRNRWST